MCSAEGLWNPFGFAAMSGMRGPDLFSHTPASVSAGILREG